MRKNEKAFTLIELIASVAILGILMALIVPNYIKHIDASMKKAAQTECAGCVSAAMAEQAGGELDETVSPSGTEQPQEGNETEIRDEPVALAAEPDADEPKESEPLSVKISDGGESGETLEQQARVKGSITELKYAGGELVRLVYTTKNGRYTVTYENGGYTVEKNR